MSKRHFATFALVPEDIAPHAESIIRAIETSVCEIRHAVALGGNGISKSGSVYIGLTGVAYMYYHLANHVKRGLQLNASVLGQAEQLPAVTAQALYSEALAMCSSAEASLLGRADTRVTFLEGWSGLLALKCALLAALGQHAESRRLAAQLVSYAQSVRARLAPQECEVLYGRAGLLYALLFAHQTCPGADIPAAAINELVMDLVKEGRRCATAAAQPVSSELALLYEWHGQHYLGAAHGLMGVIQMIAQAGEFVRAGADCAEVEFVTKRAALAAAERLSLPSGNLPSSLGNTHDRLVHWCHGAPGLLMALSAMHAQHGSRPSLDFRHAMQKSEEVTWRRGLLRKGLGLCHGIAGNGYAFLAAYRATGETAFKHKANAFGLFAADVREQLLGVPDHPCSLFEGLAGTVCFWSDLLFPDQSHFPGYELPVV